MKHLRPTHTYERENTHWTTRDGRHVTPATMDDDHLRNLTRFLERNARGYVRAEMWHLVAIYPEDPSDGVFWALEGEMNRLEYLSYEASTQECVEYVKQMSIYICVMNEIAYRQYLKEPQWVTDTTTDSTASNAEMWISWQEFLADLMLRTWGLESPIRVWRMMRLSTLAGLRSSLHHLEL
jgi:hypothetical protein